MVELPVGELSVLELGELVRNWAFGGVVEVEVVEVDVRQVGEVR